MVFKSVRNSLSFSAATWAFSFRAHHVTQDHPVHIPRDLNCSVSCPPETGYHLRIGQIVADEDAEQRILRVFGRPRLGDNLIFFL